MSRGEVIADRAPHVVADVTLYAEVDGGPPSPRRAGWACPCMISTAEPLEGVTGLPQLGEVAFAAGETRRLGFVFPGDGAAERIREAGAFYLWEGGFIGEARVVGGGALDLPKAFDLGQTGKGCTVPNIDQLLRLADYAATRGAIISNVEVFELRGEFEYARIDLSIYGWEPEQRDLPFADKTALATQRLGWLVEDVAKEGVQFLYLAWLDDGT